ncbi:MAG: hypothetical protein HYV09_12985 [Deltaproteobacteria bacterium]|nr:hypothetical protein [Deltaproteobacteria bacterium]
MARPLKLPVPLHQFLADADRVAAMLDRDGDQLAAATQGRIHRGMADEIRKYVEEVRQIEATRDRSRVGSIAGLKREAISVVSRVAAGVRWAAKSNPMLATRLSRVRRECPVRSVSVAAMAFGLEGWAALIREHRADLEPLLGPDVERKLEELARALREAPSARRDENAARRAEVAARNALVEKIAASVTGVRALARLVVPVA